MQPNEQELMVPVDLGDRLSLQERKEFGERVEEMLSSSTFAQLLEVIAVQREGVITQVVYRPPAESAAQYADAMGHVRGLNELEGLAQGIVQDGKEAAGEILRIEREGE